MNEISESAHSNAVSKGFYELPESILSKMDAGDSSFSREEIQAVKDAFVAQRLMLIVSELGEALEANRKKGPAPHIKGLELDLAHGVDYKEAFVNNYIKDSFEDELADTVIRIGDLSGWLGIDLDTHIALKQKYNSRREKMHGKAY